MDKCESKNTSAFVPDFDSDLCDNSSIRCLDETDDNSPKQSYIMGGALIIMAFESLQSALSRPTWREQGRDLVTVGILYAGYCQPSGETLLSFFHKVSLPAGLKSRARTTIRALTAWVLFLMHK